MPRELTPEELKVLEEAKKPQEPLKVDPASYLQFELVQRGAPQNNMDTFWMIFTDMAGTVHLCMFGCRTNFTELITKAFQKIIIPQLTKQQEETKENEEKGTSDETKPGENCQPVS